MNTKELLIKTKEYAKHTLEEKIELIKNPKKIVHEMKELGRKEGLPFMCYAIAIEVAEDVGVPIILATIGKPEYIPIVWAWHSEPVMYPLYFGIRKYIELTKQEKQTSSNK